MDMNKATDMESKKYRVKVMVLMGLFLVAVIAGAIFITPFRWPIGFFIWLILIVGAGLYFLIRWHAKNTAYICPRCSHIFTISTLKDFLSPHMIDKKLLHCPECGENSWCKDISVKGIRWDTSEVKEKKDIIVKPPKYLYVQIGIVVLAYAVLWAYTLYIYSQLPETIPAHFDLTGNPDAWAAKSSALNLPLIATALPVLHSLFCLYAARQGYKSFVYYLLTGVNVFCLLIFLGIQHLILMRAM